ncbi:hypothetical protein [Macrococcus equipercicus]|nr:hypothetical protein [Macrococcus equipercicus]
MEFIVSSRSGSYVKIIKIYIVLTGYSEANLEAAALKIKKLSNLSKI